MISSIGLEEEVRKLSLKRIYGERLARKIADKARIHIHIESKCMLYMTEGIIRYYNEDVKLSPGLPCSPTAFLNF